jgi:hypothetical protein
MASLHRRQAHLQVRRTPRMTRIHPVLLGHPGQTPRVPFLLPFTCRSTP